MDLGAIRLLARPLPHQVRRMTRGARDDQEHRPSLVLELPPGRQAWCVGCSKPWPCPDAPTLKPCPAWCPCHAGED